MGGGSIAARPGRVFWITGLSGAGKTTVAREVAAELRKTQDVVFLDGDELREIFGGGAGAAYDDEARKALSLRYARLCRMLSEQGLTVVCATISMFASTREWNRAHIPGYIEVYVRVPIDELKRRDSKGIYSRAAKGELNDVVGVDIPFDEPANPDIVIENHAGMTPAAAAARILKCGEK